MKQTPTRHKLLILDACYGTAGVKAQDRSMSDRMKASDPTIQIFAWSQDNQFGTESAEVGGGIFTHVLVEVLKGSNEKSGIPMDQLANVGGGFKIERKINADR